MLATRRRGRGRGGGESTQRPGMGNLPPDTELNPELCHFYECTPRWPHPRWVHSADKGVPSYEMLLLRQQAKDSVPW